MKPVGKPTKASTGSSWSVHRCTSRICDIVVVGTGNGLRPVCAPSAYITPCVSSHASKYVVERPARLLPQAEKQSAVSSPAACAYAGQATVSGGGPPAGCCSCSSTGTGLKPQATRLQGRCYVSRCAVISQGPSRTCTCSCGAAGKTPAAGSVAQTGSRAAQQADRRAA